MTPMKSSVAPLVISSAVKKQRNKKHTAICSLKIILFSYIIKKKTSFRKQPSFVLSLYISSIVNIVITISIKRWNHC